MERATGTRFGPQQLAILVVVMATLAGCEEGLIPQEDPPEDTAADDADNTNRFELFPEAATGKQRDVEAPEVFQVTEAGLWDGRPSLGGIWVAHPDVTQPERVRIKNTANNKTVTGALFRRERSLPGPALQVSSSAAEQLGMLAGAPTKVQVVALRREAIEQPPAPAEAEPTDSTELAEGEETADASETEAVEKPQKRKWWQKKPSDETAAGVAVVAGAAAGTAVASSDDNAPPAEVSSTELAAAETPAPEKPAKRKWWQKKPSDEAAAATGAATAAVVASETPSSETPTATLTDPELTPPAEKSTKRKWWQKKDPEEIIETPLDPIAGAAAAIDASEPTTAAPVAASTTATAGGLAKPYVQAGTFSVESNAKSAADKIRRNGMSADVFELKSEDKSVWRVLVGPVATRAERRAMLNDVKDLGFTDAFTAKN